MKHKLYILLSILFLGCDNKSFTVANDSETFLQETTINNKVDIVWIIDGSLTMANHQTNLGTNFDKFIGRFSNKGFDFNMVIASTDSWLREVNYNTSSWCSANPNPTNNPLTPYVSSADCKSTKTTFGETTMFRDGDIYGSAAGLAGSRSGKYLITSSMSAGDLVSTFQTNVKTGTRGDGSRESAFQSLRSVLRRNEDGSIGYNNETHTVLSSFRRNDAFLAIIVVSDEEDQSKKQDGSDYLDVADYTNQFLTFLDGYTNNSVLERRYSVSGIVLEDINNCQYGLHPQATQGDRYVAIAQATRGVIGNICSTNFSDSLENISEKIISLATRFRLKRMPVPASIKITVNGTIVPQGDIDGWTYYKENESHYIEFHGESIPDQNAVIKIDFKPATLN